MKRLYSVLDLKSCEFSIPFESANDAAATRMFRSTVNDGERGGLIARYPEDYQLWFVGEFDVSGGTFSGVGSLVVGGASLVDQKGGV